MKIHDLAQQSLLLSPSAGHISGHMLWFYSPKTQEECKSQQERDEREGVAHGVHQLQGGQQGIVLHLDMGRADMTTRMQSVTPPSPQLHAQSHQGPGTNWDTDWASSLLLDLSFSTLLVHRLAAQTALAHFRGHKAPWVRTSLSLMPWLDSQPSTHSPGLAISEGTEP